MFLEIKDVLTPPEVARLNALSRELRFVDGRVMLGPLPIGRTPPVF